MVSVGSAKSILPMNAPIQPGHASPPSRPTFPGPAPRRVVLRGALAALLALALLVGAPVGARAAPAGSPAPRPTDAERAAYWLDRIVKGPEPTALAIPRFHKELLADAERNLIALGDVTLERLSEPEWIERTQLQEDTNPWHTILAIVTALGPRRPEVARAWAVPAIRHEQLTLRRASIAVFEALRSPADGPVLLDALARNGDDRLLAPRLAGLLLRFGAPYDGEAARTIYARAVADRPEGASSLWTDLPAVASDAPDRARPDLLAWWSLLTEVGGPRAPDPVKVGAAAARSIDPVRMVVLASPHALTSARLAAAEARFALARQGNATAVRFVEADLGSPDPTVSGVARRFADRPATPVDRDAVRARAMAYVAALSGADAPTPEQVSVVARALRSDESPDALRRLEDLFRAMPPTPVWKGALIDVFEGLVVRGGALEEAMRRLLFEVGTPDAVNLAFYCILHAPGSAYIPIVEEWLATPAAAWRRLRTRRELAFLYTSRHVHHDLDAATAATYAANVRGFVEDPEDPSGASLASVLLDLGAAGEAALAKGLAGPRRGLYLDGLDAGANRYVGRAVVEAILAPLDRRTPVEERQRLLRLVFRTASASSADVLEAAAARLPEAGRAELETVLRIVRHRAG